MSTAIPRHEIKNYFCKQKSDSHYLYSSLIQVSLLSCKHTHTDSQHIILLKTPWLKHNFLQSNGSIYYQHHLDLNSY